MPSARLDSHRNSVQNGVVESFPALTGTIFVNVFAFLHFTYNFRAEKPWAKPTSPFTKAPWGREFSQSANFVENRARTGSGNDAKT